MSIDLFEHIAQVAPGFIGVAAAKFMDYDTRTDSVTSCLSKYFLLPVHHGCARWRWLSC